MSRRFFGDKSLHDSRGLDTRTNNANCRPNAEKGTQSTTWGTPLLVSLNTRPRTRRGEIDSSAVLDVCRGVEGIFRAPCFGRDGFWLTRTGVGSPNRQNHSPFTSPSFPPRLRFRHRAPEGARPKQQLSNRQVEDTEGQGASTKKRVLTPPPIRRGSFCVSGPQIKSRWIAKYVEIRGTQERRGHDGESPVAVEVSGVRGGLFPFFLGRGGSNGFRL